MFITMTFYLLIQNKQHIFKIIEFECSYIYHAVGSAIIPISYNLHWFLSHPVNATFDHQFRGLSFIMPELRHTRFCTYSLFRKPFYVMQLKLRYSYNYTRCPYLNHLSIIIQQFFGVPMENVCLLTACSNASSPKKAL